MHVLPGHSALLRKRNVQVWDVLCRLMRDNLAHAVPWPDEALPDPMTQALPKFQAADIDVCQLLPDLLGCSETHFIAEIVTLFTNLKCSFASPAPGGGSSSSAPSSSCNGTHSTGVTSISALSGGGASTLPRGATAASVGRFRQRVPVTRGHSGLCPVASASLSPGTALQAHATACCFGPRSTLWCAPRGP